MHPVVQPSVVSLFAGIGGFDLGFERAGFKIVGHVEKDAKCRELLAAKWPDAVALDDVCTAGKHNLPECDVVTFGFPCQDLSVAGKRAGMKKGETRSGLFYEATRIIDELKPAYCVFENVPGLLSSDKGRDFVRVLIEMDEIGYHGAWRTLDAQWFGVAQRRRRVFGVFSRLDSGAERCGEILSLRESLRGHPAPRRETGKVAPALAASGVGAGRTGNERNEVDFCIEAPIGLDEEQNASEDLFGCLKARKEGGGFEGAVAIAGTLDGKCCAANRGSQANEAEFIVPEVCGTLRGGATGHRGYNDPADSVDTMIPQICGCLSDGAHRGGGLNGQDAYSGRIIPAARCMGVAGEGCKGAGQQHEAGASDRGGKERRADQEPFGRRL